MVGDDAEASGIAKHGAKMVAAVANATVPKYSSSVVTGPATTACVAVVSTAGCLLNFELRRWLPTAETVPSISALPGLKLMRLEEQIAEIARTIREQYEDATRITQRAACGMTG